MNSLALILSNTVLAASIDGCVHPACQSRSTPPVVPSKWNVPRFGFLVMAGYRLTHVSINLLDRHVSRGE